MISSLSAEPGSFAPLRTPLGNAAQVTTSFFFDFLLPPLHDAIKFNSFVARASRSGKKGLVTQSGRLWGYNHQAPSQVQDATKAFNGLQFCARGLAKLSPKVKKAAHFRNHRDTGWTRVATTQNGLPHAYFVVGPDSEAEDNEWERIAVSGSYSLLERDRAERLVRYFSGLFTARLTPCL